MQKMKKKECSLTGQRGVTLVELEAGAGDGGEGRAGAELGRPGRAGTQQGRRPKGAGRSDQLAGGRPG